MKVRHLIRELEKCNPEYEVTTEGCDCTGDSCLLDIDDARREVEIQRSRDDWHGVDRSQDYDNADDTPKPLP